MATVGRICNFAGFKEFYDVGCQNIGPIGPKYTIQELSVCWLTTLMFQVIPFDNLRSPETSKWAITMGIRLSRVFEKMKKKC